MITGSNAEAISKQLEEYSKEVQRKLEYMVEQFAVDVVQAATENTPLGDAEKFAELYKLRQERLNLDPIEGVSQGAWVVALNGDLQFIPSYGKQSGMSAVADANMDVQGYQLGQSFKIGNAAPYIAELEGGYSPQAPDGIMQPTLDQIKAANESDFKRYYEAG